MDYKEIAKYIIQNGLFAGVRTTTDDEKYEAGDYCRESYEWDLEHDCSTYDLNGKDGLKAGGTCCTAVIRDLMSEYKDDWEDEEYLNEVAQAIETAVKYNNDHYFKYYGEHQVLIVGDDINTNIEADDFEYRIVDAKVLTVIA